MSCSSSQPLPLWCTEMKPSEFLASVAPTLPLTGGEDHHTEAGFHFDGRFVRLEMVEGIIYVEAGSGAHPTQFVLRLDDPRLLEKFRLGVSRAT